MRGEGQPGSFPALRAASVPRLPQGRCPAARWPRGHLHRGLGEEDASSAAAQPQSGQFPSSLGAGGARNSGGVEKTSAPTAAGRDALAGSGLSANEVSVLPLALLGSRSSWSPLGARASRSRSSQELSGSLERRWLMPPRERRLCRLSASTAPGRIRPMGCGEQKAPQHRHRAAGASWKKEQLHEISRRELSRDPLDVGGLAVEVPPS